MEHRKICVSYLITAVLLVTFIYYVGIRNVQIESKILNLQEEVAEIARVVLRSGNNMPSRSAVTAQTDIVGAVESVVKKRISGIWEEISNLKRQFSHMDCSRSIASSSETHSQGAVAEKSELRPNYALESLGAKIERIEGDPWCVKNFLWIVPVYVANEPKNIINPSMEPGHCYAFRKNNSAVTIKLSAKIIIEAFVLEHISNDLVPGDTSNAPKDFSVHGINSETKLGGVHLGDFQYDNSLHRRAQLFEPKKLGSYDFVKVNFTSNYGNPNHTCVYRFAVYGKTKI